MSQSQNPGGGFDTDQLIELMAEGELSSPQRNELFRRLDEQPQRWRNLAIAFAETQALRSTLRRSRQLTPDKPKTETVITQKTRRPRVAQIALALAGMLAAFWLGLVVSGERPANNFPSTETQIVQTDPNIDIDTAAVPALPLDETSSGSIVGYVKWDGDHGVRLSPVFNGEIDAQWLEANPPSVDQNMQRHMSRAGWQLRPQRRFVSVKLNGGGDYTIPMDEVRYRFVGRQVF